VSGTLWLVVVTAALVVAGLGVVRFAEAVPRLGAAVELLTLAVIWLMPLLLLSSAAAAAGAAGTSPAAVIGGVCILAHGPVGVIQLALYGLGLAAVARTVLAAVRTLAAARRAELSGHALAGAAPTEVPGGQTVWIIPSGRLAAYCGGLRNPRPVVTTGLLSLLGPAEQQAVLRHEAAHARLGHPRLLLLGAVIAASYRWLPPTRLAWAALRRDMEAAADDEAAAGGAGPLLSALAKVALAQAKPSAVSGASGFADPEDLRYRIRRLQRPRPRRAHTVLALSLVGAGLAGVLAEASCLLLHAGSGWTAVLLCLAAFGYLGWRPAWARPGRPGRVGRSVAPGSPRGSTERSASS
jgi:Zn-dependent protease with chaperone function